MKGRAAIGAVGLVIGGFGVYRTVTIPSEQWVSALTWLIGGVIVHDVVLSVILVALGLFTARLLPQPWRAPLTVATIVWGSLSLLVIPVLGEYGAKPDDPWLLDRPYQATWLIGTAVVIVGVVVAGIVRTRRSAPAPSRTPSR